MSEGEDIAAAFGAKVCAVCGAVRTGIDWLFRVVPREYPGARMETGDRWSWVYTCRDADCSQRMDRDLRVHYPKWWRETWQDE